MEKKTNDLDRGLDAQRPLARLVRDLPDDELPMAWRADLNSKLEALAPAPRRHNWMWIWKPTLGLGLAGALALAVVMTRTPRPMQPGSGTDVAQAMLRAHEQSVAQNELGTVASETLDSDTVKDSIEWNEGDLTTL